MLYNLEDFTVEIGDLKINCRPWTSKEERNWLNIKDENSNLQDVAKVMILPNIQFKPMTVDEFIYLSFKMRGLSLSGEIDFSYRCSNEECKHLIDVTAPLEELVHFQPSNFEDGDSLKEEDIEITIRRIPTKELLLRVLNENDVAERRYLEFLASIKTIKYRNKIFESFTFDEAKAFFDSVPSKLFNSLYSKFFDIKGHVSLFHHHICPFCQKETRVTFDSVTSFL